MGMVLGDLVDEMMRRVRCDGIVLMLRGHLGHIRLILGRSGIHEGMPLVPGVMQVGLAVMRSRSVRVVTDLAMGALRCTMNSTSTYQPL